MLVSLPLSPLLYGFFLILTTIETIYHSPQRCLDSGATKPLPHARLSEGSVGLGLKQYRCQNGRDPGGSGC